MFSKDSYNLEISALHSENGLKIIFNIKENSNHSMYFAVVGNM
jgi:hypothetical protein